MFGGEHAKLIFRYNNHEQQIMERRGARIVKETLLSITTPELVSRHDEREILPLQARPLGFHVSYIVTS